MLCWFWLHWGKMHFLLINCPKDDKWPHVWFLVPTWEERLCPWEPVDGTFSSVEPCLKVFVWFMHDVQIVSINHFCNFFVSWKFGVWLSVQTPCHKWDDLEKKNWWLVVSPKSLTCGWHFKSTNGKIVFSFGKINSWRSKPWCCCFFGTSEPIQKINNKMIRNFGAHKFPPKTKIASNLVCNSKSCWWITKTTCFGHFELCCSCNCGFPNIRDIMASSKSINAAWRKCQAPWVVR